MRVFRRSATFLFLLGFVCLCGSELASPQTARPSSTQEGLQLLHKMQAALGGADRIAAIHDYEEIVRAQTWSITGAPLGEVRKRTRWMRYPNLIRLDQIGARDTYVLFFEGASGAGWEILPDVSGPENFKTTGKLIDLVGGELKFAKGYLFDFQFNQWLADRMPGYTVTSPAANVLRIEHDGDATDLTLDSATGLPVKTAGVSLADPDHPASAELRYEGWTKVSGVRVPAQRANYHNGVKMGEIINETVRVNSGLTPQQLAAEPAGDAPDIRPR
jgi:hypothetical protein